MQVNHAAPALSPFMTAQKVGADNAPPTLAEGADQPGRMYANPPQTGSFWICTQEVPAAHANVRFTPEAVRLFGELGKPVKGLNLDWRNMTDVPSESRDFRPGINVVRDKEMKQGFSHSTIRVDGLTADGAARVAKVEALWSEKATRREFVYDAGSRVQGGVHCVNYAVQIVEAATNRTYTGPQTIDGLRSWAFELSRNAASPRAML